MNSMGHKVLLLLLVMLLCFGTPLIASAGDGALTSKHSTIGKSSLNKSHSQAQSQARSEESSVGATLMAGSEEPLQMMVSGLILFAIATTFRRFKSRSRANTVLKGR